jgi:hypothetical protein
LYYFHSETIHSPKVSRSKQSSTCSDSDNGTFFGLQAGKDTSTAGLDFSSRLLEAHWCFGHLHFDKLRKLLGLKKGTNPDCAACTMAKSRAESLSDHAYTRATRPCYRMHMDIGFTRNSEFSFQIHVDDYDRISHLTMLNNKNEALAKWIELKNHLETAHYPYKFAFIKTDSEPLYLTAEWRAHAKAEHLQHECSSRYRHDQHGVAERCMLTIGTAFRCMMFQGCAPEADIPDALTLTTSSDATPPHLQTMV